VTSFDEFWKSDILDTFPHSEVYWAVQCLSKVENTCLQTVCSTPGTSCAASNSGITIFQYEGIDLPLHRG